MRDYFLARLREPSTWRGIIFVLSALGVAIRPDLAEAIITLGVALAGGVAIAAPDRLPERVRPADVPAADPAATGPAPDYPRSSGREDLERWERP